jgi:hypothetical protein
MKESRLSLDQNPARVNRLTLAAGRLVVLCATSMLCGFRSVYPVGTTVASMVRLPL